MLAPLRIIAFLSLMLLACAACARQGNSAPMDTAKTFHDSASAVLADAVKAGDAARIKELVAGGANPNAQGEKGLPMLQWAMLNQSRDGFDALLAAGADPARGNDDGVTAVHLAAMADTDYYLRKLLEKGASPDTPNTVTGVTPLMAALMAERADHADFLLKSGAKVAAADRQGNTALHLAAKINETGRVLQLLEAGADPNAKNAQGVTFQRYLFMTPETSLDLKSKREREQVREWLQAHNIAVEAG
ncbi:ankyrin repeat domain-containing protein [Luteimonas gilva]|uniref:Ankyrin repeat domain-containing protein n=1 Tax=Luteimonas gilva TaxID=2572684 RepID=A0A4U5JQN3_9GAMM|nr:ankyrin repeat domain-containing protein [Luteimonas gilva]TKR30217.1 ankyrin repeat domain-containing protein [Luteimonas gilva]